MYELAFYIDMFELKYQCLLVSIACTSVSLSILTDIWTHGWTDVRTFGIVLQFGLALLLITSAVILFDIYRLGPAASHTYLGVLKHYMQAQWVSYQGWRVYSKDKTTAVKANEFQRNNLMTILRGASKTIYGKEKGFAKILTLSEFRRNVPLSSYPNFEQYVNRVMSGEKNVMFEGEPIYIGLTSGTTGKCKIYPKSRSCIHIGKDYIVYHAQYITTKAFPSVTLKKMVMLQTYFETDKAALGCRMGPISALAHVHKNFYVEPKNGYYLSSASAARYVKLLYALKERDVGMITSSFSSSVLLFFQYMEANWNDFCDDIEAGRIRSGFGIPEKEFQLLTADFKPDPQRANKLRNEFRQGFRSIARRIWPGCKITTMASSGVFAAPSAILRDTYLRGIPNFSRSHGSTEAVYGRGIFEGSLNDDPVYSLLHRSHFFELLPHDDTKNEETILPYEAEIDKYYEIVVTTDEGLYRYRTGDIIQCVGFDGQSLRYKFIQRVGDSLCLKNERTPLRVVENAIFTALREVVPGETMAEYCCTESIHVERVKGENKGQLAYWIFVEMDSNGILPSIFAKKVMGTSMAVQHAKLVLTDRKNALDIKQVEQKLIDDLKIYTLLRITGTANEAVVVQLKAGTFRKVRDHFMATKSTTSLNQYKTPRITRQDNVIQIFLDNIM